MERVSLSMNRHAKRILIIFILYLMTLLGSIYYTYAYFNKDETHQINLNIGVAFMDTEIAFDGIPIDSSSPYYDTDNELIIINASDPESENAISKLSVNITITPEYASRIRIKLKESYIKERRYLSTGETLTETMAVTENRVGFHPFSYLMYGDTYQMTLGDEGYQYYPDILNENSQLVLPIISGGLTVYGRSNTQFVETIILRLQITIEVVQANRYQEIWGIDGSIFQ